MPPNKRMERRKANGGSQGERQGLPLIHEALTAEVG